MVYARLWPVRCLYTVLRANCLCNRHHTWLMGHSTHFLLWHRYFYIFIINCRVLCLKSQMTSVFGNSSFITGQWSRGILRTCESHKLRLLHSDILKYSNIILIQHIGDCGVTWLTAQCGNGCSWERSSASRQLHYLL